MVAPGAFPASLTHDSWAVDALSLVSDPVEWEIGCNEREKRGNRGEQVAGGSEEEGSIKRAMEHRKREAF